MEAQLPRSNGHDYDQEPYNAAGVQTVAAGHEDEQHHEKKSVLGKVKAKAKKIKNTLTKHSHGQDQDQDHDHDHEHEHEQNGHDEEEDYDDDEEMVEDQEVNGAPVYDSASVTVPAPPTGSNSGQPTGNLEKPSVMEEDHYESSKISEPPVRSFAQGEEENSGQTRGNLGSSASKPEDKRVSSGVHAQDVNDPIGNGSGRGEIFGDPVGNENFSGPFEGRGENLPESGGNVGGRGREFTESSGNVKGPGENSVVGIGGGSMGIEEDPPAPPKDRSSNDQTNVADPTGTGKEIGITPTLHSQLDKMDINEEPQHKPKPEAKQKLHTGSHNQFSPETNTPTTNPHETSPLDHSLSENPSSNQSSYTQMISSAAFSVANKAAEAKNAVASTIGYGGTETERPSRDSAERPNEMHEGVEATKGVSKVAQVGPDNGVSGKKSWVEKLRPGDEDKALSEVISGAFTNKGKEGGAEEKEGEDSRGICQVLSDAVHKRAPEKNEREEDTRRSMGKVTDSKAVAEPLGTGGEVGGGGVGVGKGVVDMVRGTVSSWLGKGSESQTSQVGNEGTSGGEAAHGHGQDDVGETSPRNLNN